MASVAPPSPIVLLWARGVVAILDLWPALTIAVVEEWGGVESLEKKTWMASTILDEFESRITYLSSPSSDPATNTPPTIDPRDADDPPLDLDDLADLINQMMTDEFEAKIEDGSIDAIASDMLQLWRHLLLPPAGETAESVLAQVEHKARAVKKAGFKATSGQAEIDDEGDSTSGSDDEHDGMDVEDAPSLVPVSQSKVPVEPIVDEDGFELVSKGGRKGR